LSQTLYDKLNLNFSRDIAPVASFGAALLGHGGQSIGSSQNHF
jgi:hypothetical protein